MKSEHGLTRSKKCRNINKKMDLVKVSEKYQRKWSYINLAATINPSKFETLSLTRKFFKTIPIPVHQAYPFSRILCWSDIGMD